MGFILSPSVVVTEKDLSTSIPALATSVVGIAGPASWGPVMRRVYNASDRQFKNTFGEVTPSHIQKYVAVSFLRRGRALWYVRVAKNALYSGCSIVSSEAAGANASLAAGVADIATDLMTADELYRFYGKYQGARGNTEVKVAVLSHTDVATATLPPLEVLPDTEDESLVLVYDKVSEELLESWVVSRYSYKKDAFGKSMWAEDVINVNSAYINTNARRADLEVAGSLKTVKSTVTGAETKTLTFVELAGGTDGDAVTDTELVAGYDLFRNPLEVDVNILVSAGATEDTVQNKVKEICESRKDCVAILDVPLECDTAQECVDFRRGKMTGHTAFNPNSSYAGLYGPWFKTRDTVNDKIIWLPASARVAGVFAYNDQNAAAWYAPAGFNRGIVDDIIELKFNPEPGDLDLLYSNGINPLVNWPGDGYVVWGQKTLQSKPSAFDRINVRRLLITLEKAIATAAKYMLFEFNDVITRTQFLNMVEPFLEGVKQNRGLIDFMVVCDESNNTPEVIDANEFVGDIYLAPAKAGEFFRLNFIVTKTGVNFGELAKAA